MTDAEALKHARVVLAGAKIDEQEFVQRVKALVAKMLELSQGENLLVSGTAAITFHAGMQEAMGNQTGTSDDHVERISLMLSLLVSESVLSEPRA